MRAALRGRFALVRAVLHGCHRSTMMRTTAPGATPLTTRRAMMLQTP